MRTQTYTAQATNSPAQVERIRETRIVCTMEQKHFKCSQLSDLVSCPCFIRSCAVLPWFYLNNTLAKVCLFLTVLFSSLSHSLCTVFHFLHSRCRALREAMPAFLRPILILVHISRFFIRFALSSYQCDSVFCCTRILPALYAIVLFSICHST